MAKPQHCSSFCWLRQSRSVQCMVVGCINVSVYLCWLCWAVVQTVYTAGLTAPLFLGNGGCILVLLIPWTRVSLVVRVKFTDPGATSDVKGSNGPNYPCMFCVECSTLLQEWGFRIELDVTLYRRGGVAGWQALLRRLLCAHFGAWGWHAGNQVCIPVVWLAFCETFWLCVWCRRALVAWAVTEVRLSELDCHHNMGDMG